MNWEAIGAIGEIVGAAAVLITLVYLASQVRQNTAQTREAMLQDSVDTVSVYEQAILNNRQVAELIIQGRNDLSNLDEADHLRFRNYCMMLYRGLWLQDRRNQLGALEDYEEGAAIEWMAIYLNLNPGSKEMWDEIKSYFPADFQDRITRKMDKLSSAKET